MNGRKIRLSVLAATLLASAPMAFAASAGAPQMTTKPMHGQAMATHTMGMPASHRMRGEHNMPGKVTSVDHRTGIVKVDSLGMHLVVHFPPPTIKELKVGDMISLHLGYRITKG